MNRKLGSTLFFALAFTLGAFISINASYGQQPYPSQQPSGPSLTAPRDQQQPQANPNYGRPGRAQYGTNQQNYRQPTYQNRPPQNTQPQNTRQSRQPANYHTQPGQNRQPGGRQMNPIRRPAPPRAPFQLTRDQQAYVDKVLAAWEKYGDRIDTFEAKFTLRIYGDLFQQNNQAPTPQPGELKYKKPAKGYFEVKGTQPTKWICDGNSLYKYEYSLKEVKQYPLPPEERGKGIQNGPLPFLFGAKAADLKKRYWVRALPSPKNGQKQIWLQVFPKHARDSAEFTRAELIVSTTMKPIGIMLHMPNGKETYSYVFQDININNPLKNIFKGDPFKPKLERGWKTVVENVASAQPPGRQPSRQPVPRRQAQRYAPSTNLERKR